MTTESKPKYTNTCPDCGGAGYRTSQSGSRPVYRCFNCPKTFGG